MFNYNVCKCKNEMITKTNIINPVVIYEPDPLSFIPIILTDSKTSEVYRFVKDMVNAQMLESRNSYCHIKELNDTYVTLDLQNLDPIPNHVIVITGNFVRMTCIDKPFKSCSESSCSESAFTRI